MIKNWQRLAKILVRQGVFAGLMMLLPITAIKAQVIDGRIVGFTTDATGAVVPHASIKIVNLDTNAARTIDADEQGNFFAPALPPGNYQLEGIATGFSPYTATGIKVEVGSDILINVKFTVALMDSVIVQADRRVLQPDSGEISEVIDNKQVDSLPLNGRDFRRLVTLVPGAAPRSPRGSLGSFTINGQREKANIFLIDGVDNNDSFRNQPSFNQGGVIGAPATLLPIDAIEELSVQVQGNAEFGRNAGAVVNTAIKAGTNEFHGTLYEFLRNDNLDAKNFFESLPGSKGEFKNNNFGGVLGGPFVRNRTFFFIGYEGQRERASSTFAVAVPSPAILATARAVNQQLGRRENPLSTRILSLFPAANNVSARNNLIFNSTNLNDSDNLVLRVDHRLTDRFTFNGRYILGDGEQVFPLTTGAGSPLPDYQTVVKTRVQLVGINTTQTINSKTINEFRVSYNRFFQDFQPLDANFDPASIGLITGSRSLPTITIPGFVSLGAPTNVPRGRVSSSYQLVDNFTLIRNSHNFKFGGEYRRAIVNSFNDTLARGRLNFNSLADFLAGIVSPTNTARITGDTRRDTFTNNFGLFFQDDWRVRRDLTITYGIRYEYLGVLSENDDRLSNFSPDKGLVQVGTSQLDQLYQSDRNNFAPRIGLAYDVNNRGRLILRAGYGIYFDTPSQDYFLAQGFDSPSVGNNPIANLGINTISFAPGTAIPFGVNVPIFDPNRALGLRATPLLAVDQRLRTPYVQNYNFNIQYLLGANSVLQTGYVGSIGTRLFRIRDINQPTPGPAASRQGRRPFFNQFPQFGAINYLETTANSNYHALQLSFRQRVASLTLFAAYTYSKSIDDASNGIFSGTAGIAFPQNSHNLRAERALSSFDSRNRFTANFVYDANILPLLLAALPQVLTTGWQFTGTVTFSGGVPITPFLPFDNSGTGNLNDRPNLVSAPQRQAPGNVTAFFNTAAFALPAPGTFGNAGRNIIIGPNFITTDFAVNKRTKITERLSLQFRGEIFNIFNRPNFSLPNVQFTSPAFGTIGETLDVTAGNPRLGEGGPRTIQLGLKFIF